MTKLISFSKAAKFLEISNAELMTFCEANWIPYQEINCKSKCCFFFNKKDLIKFKTYFGLIKSR